MTKLEKMNLLLDLQGKGVVRELPAAKGYWRFKVLKSDELPGFLKSECTHLGLDEIRC